MTEHTTRAPRLRRAYGRAKARFGASFFKNVAVISLGGVVAKAIGACYRIPLSNLLGGYGAGLYQMAYPLFCLMLTFTSFGVPAAIARVVSAERAAGASHTGTVRAALAAFAALGTAGALFMAPTAPLAARLQGDVGLTRCYFALLPAVPLVALIAVLRGYFQGCGKMAPTALSELAEQTVKAAVGLLLAARAADPAHAAAAALFGVTVSEGAALLLLAAFRRAERGGRRLLSGRRPAGAGLLTAALPAMAAAALLPVSQMADSVLLVRLLSRHTARAVSLYGLFAGNVASLIGLPAALCSGLAATSVPVVSACFARGDEAEGRRRTYGAVLTSLALAVPCAVGLYVAARPVAALLFPSLSPQDGALLVGLLRLSSVSAAAMAAVNTLAACLTGMGRARCAAFSMAVAVAVKFLLQWMLVGDPAFSVGGAAVASNACYLVAFFLDLFYTKKKKPTARQYDHNYRARCGKGRRIRAGACGDAGGGRRMSAHGGAPLGGKLDRGGDPLSDI